MLRKNVTGAEAVIITLETHGIDIIFGIPGGHSLALYDALSRQDSIRHILGRHEQGLGFMADGYARASGRVGVLTTTSGPAVANLACALGGATTDTSPVLAISSTIRSELIGKNRGELHDCGESIDIMRPVCRYTCRCKSVEEIPETIAGFFHILKTRRPGAAYIEIPYDILNTKTDVEIPCFCPPEPIQPDDGEIEAVIGHLMSAKRPLLWVGTGAMVSEAGAEIESLAGKLGAIIVNTSLGRGILPADHPNVINLDGALMIEVNQVIARADVVLAVGTMFKQEDTANWSTIPGKKLIHIDIDPEELGRSYKPEIGIVADAKAALETINGRMPKRAPVASEWVKQGKQAEADRLERRRSQSALEMQVLDILRDTVPRDGILVCDRCNLGCWAYRCLPVYEPRSFIYPMGYGTLGGALPQAMGAKLACPDKPVVCVIGDGGFHFTATELAVAVQENISFTIVLSNNNAYGAIRAGQDRNFGGRHFGVKLQNPDFSLIASAYGIDYARAGDPDTFRHTLDKGIKSGQLNIIELTVELRDP